MSLNHVYDNLHRIEKYQEADSILEKTDAPIEAIERELKLEDISWHYQNTDKEVISGLNLTIRKGDSIALVGMSGAEELEQNSRKPKTVWKNIVVYKFNEYKCCRN